jgi:hypothetical protein
MKHMIRFGTAKRQGMALLLVVFVAFASLVLLTTLLASVAPRRATVSGELQADRALAVADGTIDLIMNTINTLPPVTPGQGVAESELHAAIISYWEGMLNGYGSDAYSSANASGVSTYFYHTTTNTWYAVWDTTDGHLMNIPSATKLGREVGPSESTTGTTLELAVKNLSTNDSHASGVIVLDSNCRTNNEWFEVDTNTMYNVTPTDVWTMRASAYMLSRTSIVRTLEAKAVKVVNLPSEGFNWFYTTNGLRTFADYVFLDDFAVNFGVNSVIDGFIHANGTINMGGWAKLPVTSTAHVTDIAVDLGNSNVGTFGPVENTLTWAKMTRYNPSEALTWGNSYAGDHANVVPWLQVDASLLGATPMRVPYPLETGMQDRAVIPYYVDMSGTGTATIVFSVENDVGWVTINGTKHGMPENGVIYVNGNATVKGTVLGTCIVGANSLVHEHDHLPANGHIYIGGDILYHTLPRTTENAPATEEPDFLGLVASGNVVIPYATFLADKNLIIDAAMVADGWLGINPSEWTWHNLNTGKTAPTLVVRGSMAAGDGTNMMAQTQVNNGVKQIKGYDLRQYSFDWNLRQVGVPAGFPTTGTELTSKEMIVSRADATALGLTDPAAHPKANPLSVNGTAYYARAADPGTVPNETTGFVSGYMYRIGWKEQIGNSVDHSSP